ncbi:hypothetical protein [Amycolatopsis sp. NPDC003731]
MLAIYAYGTNTGIRAVAAGGGHAYSEGTAALRPAPLRDPRGRRSGRRRDRERHLPVAAVHAMVGGAARHGNTMSVESNYVGSHSQSEIVFGITRLLARSRNVAASGTVSPHRVRRAHHGQYRDAHMLEPASE